MHRCVALLLAAILGGCDTGSRGVDDILVDESDMYYKDAVSRLTEKERENLLFKNDKILGFSFRGEKFTCVILFNNNKNTMSSAPQPAFCYHRKSNEFAGRL